MIIDMSNFETFNYPSPKEKYKVLVRCFTYNHREYIEDALNGFAMQQTSFPFVCLVMDDASTDGEQDVIKSWMERECDMSKAEFIDIPTSHVVIVPHKSNLSCTFAFYLLKQNLHGTGDKKMNHVYPWRMMCEYEAMCEGDDYWTDSLKLQKQVDFLDAHTEFGMCYTQCNYYYQNKKYLESQPWGGTNESFKQFIMGNTVPTLTVMIRTEKESEYIDAIKPSTKKWLMGDYPKWIWFSHESKIKFLNYSTGVYRVLTTSASHSTDINKQIEFSSNSIEIRRYFEHYFNVPAGTYVKMEALDKRKLYLYAVNHKYLDFFKIIYNHPKYLYNMKVIGYLRYFLMKPKTSDLI